MQETLWLLYQGVGTLRTVSAFSAWLFAIVLPLPQHPCVRRVLAISSGR